MSTKFLIVLNLLILAVSLITLFGFCFKLAESENVSPVNNHSFLIALGIVSAACLYNLNNLKK